MGCGCGKSSSTTTMSTIKYQVVFTDGTTSDPLTRTEANRLLRDSATPGRITAVRVPA